jgi:hypothetical protein
VPVTPGLLAGILMMTSGLHMKELQASLLKINEANPDFKVWLSQNSGEEIFIELLCALTCLAFHILSWDDLAPERGLFELYAMGTLQQLENLLGERMDLALFWQAAEEARKLYLCDKPSLRELVAIKGVPGWFTEEIDRAEREQNWLWTYGCKAGIRIVGKLPVPNRSIWYLPSHHLIQLTILTHAEFFKTLRPVLVAPGDARG